MKLLKLALIGAVSLPSFSATGISAFAEEKDGGKMDSKTDITFKANTDSAEQIDPTNPTNPVKPEKPDEHEKGTPGPLSIDYVSNISFGEQSISSKDMVYYAKVDRVKQEKDGKTIEVPNYVQVTDNRGTNIGWKLTVKQNGQFKSDAHELKGAELQMSNPFANSEVSEKLQPSANNLKLDPSGQAIIVANAPKDKGMGTWTIAYGKDKVEGQKSITLNVPGTTAKIKDTKYTTSLTWTLEDTPN